MQFTSRFSGKITVDGSQISISIDLINKPENSYKEMGLSLFDVMLSTAQEYVSANGNVFSGAQLFRYTKFPVNRRSFGTYLMALTENHPSRHHYSGTTKGKAYFHYISRGKFKLLDKFLPKEMNNQPE